MPGRGFSKFIKSIHVFGDLILLNVAYISSFYFRFGNFDFYSQHERLGLMFLMNLIWIIISGRNKKIYSIYRVVYLEKILSDLIYIVAIHFVIVLSLITILKYNSISRSALLFTFGIFFCSIVGWRLFFIHILKLYRKAGFNYRNIIIIGAGQNGIELMDFVKSDLSYGFRFLGFFDDNPENTEKNLNVIGKLSDVENYIKDNEVNEMYCTLPFHETDKIIDLMRIAEKNLIRFKLVPDFKKFIKQNVSIDFYGHIPVILIRKEPLENWRNRLIKRVFDILFASIIIILIYPWLIPTIAILIKLSSRGPVFFRQQRSGLNNKVFWCWKFRTMYVNKDSDVKQATKGDSRITPIGAFLRKTNLDEFPQFLNVLTGDMSIVGPRPHMLKHTEEYSMLIDNYMVRHFIKPGITGFAQVNGFRGETKETYYMKKRVQYDVWYIENWSFMLDIKIIYLTVLSMFGSDENAF